MSRLLLVDDNPSIHRIAESLLAPTDVELVCVDSAAEALDRLERGEHFDVALVDTAMPGMDGWTLLARLREMEATAHLPIALMAGVLDPVDPVRLAKAPIQGFLKKPIELRELGDRVKTLLATPVLAPSDSSAFTTVPATPAKELIGRGSRAALPEFRPEYPPAPDMGEIHSIALDDSVEAFAVSESSESAAEPEDDLLVLAAEDLWPEEAPVGIASAPVPVPPPVPEVHLELEELDLESLQELASDPLPAMPSAAPLPAAPVPSTMEAVPPKAAVLESEAPEAKVQVAEALAEESLLSFTDFEVLDGLPGGLALSPAVPTHGPFGESRAMPAAEPPPVALGLTPAALGQSHAVPGQSPLSPEQIQALLADPALVDALVKAVVARMGDQVIREIAWEVMPDLAGRLQG